MTPAPAIGTLRVVLAGWVLGDGTVAPPAVGDRVAWPVNFREHDPATGLDPTTQEASGDARSADEPDIDPGPAGTTWLTWLIGDGWLACWSAPRAVAGAVRLTGSFWVDPLGSTDRAVIGTVHELQVISEEIDDGRAVPGSVRLRPVAVSPRWFDEGPPRTPRASVLEQGGPSGLRWLSAEEMEPLPRHRRETGVLVTLALDRPGVAARP